MGVRKWLGRIWYSDSDEFVLLKIVINIPIGFALGIVYYYGGVHRLELRREIDLIVGVGVVSSLAIGWSISRQIRAASVLLLPNMFTKEGRFWLTTFTYSLLLTGPIENVIVNSEETLRGISCSFNFLAAQHVEKINLMNAPLQDYGRKTGMDLTVLDRKMRTLVHGLTPGLITVKGVKKHNLAENEPTFEEAAYIDDGELEEGQYPEEGQVDRNVENRNEIDKMKNNAEQSCHGMFENAESKCREEIGKMVKECMGSSSDPVVLIIRGRLCSELDQKAACSQVASGNEVTERCNSEAAMSSDFADAFDTHEKYASSDGIDEVNLRVTGITYDRVVNQTSYQDVTKGIQQEFKRKRQLLEFITLAVRRVLAFSFVLVIRKAWKYNHQYRTEIMFDNVYATSYFKRIDARRKREKQMSILPLKSYERNEIIITSSSKLINQEKKSLLKNILTWVLRLAVIGLILAVDYVLYQILIVIRVNGKMEIEQDGHSSLQVIVKGVGTVSDTVRGMVEGFNYTYMSNNTISNEVCLPNPSKLPTHIFINIFLIAGAQLLLCLFEAYGLRLRRLIAATFYRKREKKRILYLYNDMLKRRKGYLHHARHQVRKKALQQELEQNPPFRLPCLKSSRGLKCIICETKLIANNSHQCPNECCQISYCKECWEDTREMCLACTDAEELNKVLSAMTVPNI